MILDAARKFIYEPAGPLPHTLTGPTAVLSLLTAAVASSSSCTILFRRFDVSVSFPFCLRVRVTGYDPETGSALHPLPTTAASSSSTLASSSRRSTVVPVAVAVVVIAAALGGPD